MSCDRFCLTHLDRSLRRLWMFSSILVWVGFATATDFTWIGGLSSPDWHHYEQTDWCVVGTTPEYSNNWGEVSCHPSMPLLPGGTDDVYFTAEGDAANLSQSTQIHNLSLASLTSLSIQGGSGNTTLTLGGTSIQSNGSIVINSDQWYTATLEVASYLNLTGLGVITMNAGPAQSFLTTSGTAVITQSANHQIKGSGTLSAALVNLGTVSADMDTYTLQLTGRDKTNQGDMVATAGGVLALTGFTLTQTGDGQLVADNGTVRLEGDAIVDSGALTSINGGGFILQSGNNTFSDVLVNPGTWIGIAGNSGTSTLVLSGLAIENDGTFVVNHTYQYSAMCEVNGDVLLTGSGDLRLHGGFSAAQLNTAVGSLLTHDVNHLIHGEGQLNAALDNLGTISADESGMTLQLTGQDKTNDGQIQAENSGILRMDNFTLEQGTGGKVWALEGHVDLYGNMLIRGGHLTGSPGWGIRSISGENELEAVTIDPDAWIGVNGSSGTATLVLSGATISNDGDVVINANNQYAASCRVDGVVQMEGSGAICLNGVGGQAYLDSSVSSVLMNGPDHLLCGAGIINASLENDGTVAADSTNSFVLVLTGEAKTNRGSMKAMDNGVLRIEGVTLTQNSDGVIASRSGEVQLRNGAVIQGGLLDSGTHGIRITDGNARLEDVHAMHHAWIGLAGGSGNNQLELAGTQVINDGEIVVNHNTQYSAEVVVMNDLELSGAGQMHLNAGGSASKLSTAPGATLTQVGHQILGKGDVRGQLINHGVIHANVDGQTLNLYPENAGIQNHGFIGSAANSTLTINSPNLFTQGDGGHLRANGVLQTVGGALTVNDGYLIGNGQVSGNVDHTGGRVNPGDVIGTLTLTGNYDQAAAARVVIEADGPASSDMLVVQGTADLLGELSFVWVDGYLPQPGDSFTVMTAGSVTQDFTDVWPGEGLITAEWSANALTITFNGTPPWPDYSGEGLVDLLDLVQITTATGTDDEERASPHDINVDFRVDLEDVMLGGSHWRRSN